MRIIMGLKAAYLKVDADDDARNAKQQKLESSVHGLHVSLLGVGQPGKLENHAHHRAVSTQPSHRAHQLHQRRRGPEARSSRELA